MPPHPAFLLLHRVDEIIVRRVKFPVNRPVHPLRESGSRAFRVKNIARINLAATDDYINLVHNP